MAHVPRFIVIKPATCDTYACYESGTESGDVYCQGDSVFNAFTKIELEQAKKNRMYYNLRFCHSNRYWAKSADDKWIVAISKKTQENEFLESCTLFLPSIDDKGVLQLTHVQSGIRVRTDAASTRLYVSEDGSEAYNFSYVDWEELVMIPERVVFKGDNDKILKSVTYTAAYLHFLQFASTDANDGYSAQAVSLQPDGRIRIKSEYYGKYWNRNVPSWIMGYGSDDSVKDPDTLFCPVQVGDASIALRNAGNNMFVKRLTYEGQEDCLNAGVAQISNEAKLQVQELVLESNVYNVRYRMEDARVFDEQPFLAGVGTAINESDSESSLTVKVVNEVVESTTMTHSGTIKFGTKTSIKCGWPFIAEGKVEVSVEASYTFTWAKTTSEKRAVEGLFTIKVPPKSRAKVSYVGTQGKCSVPYSYVRKDKSSSDGKYVFSHHDDGIFHGVNYYSFRFEQPAIQPL